MNVTKSLPPLTNHTSHSRENWNRSLICVCTPSSQQLGYHLVKLKIGWLVAQQEKDSHDEDPVHGDHPAIPSIATSWLINTLGFTSFFLSSPPCNGNHVRPCPSPPASLSPQCLWSSLLWDRSAAPGFLRKRKKRDGYQDTLIINFPDKNHSCLVSEWMSHL